MKYYWMTKSKEYVNAPKIMGIQKYIGVRELACLELDKLPRRFLCTVDSRRTAAYCSVLFTPLFCVERELYELVSLFEPNLKFKEMVLLDKNTGKSKEYFIPLLPRIACLTTDSKFNWNQSMVEEMCICKEAVGDHGIFVVDGIEEQLIIVRVDLLESMIRREMKGYSLKEVACVEGGQLWEMKKSI